MPFIFFLAAVFAFASARAETAPRLELSVLSYNIKGLPSFAANGYDEDRFADIGQILAKRNAEGKAPDIVALQESFVSRTAELRALAAYPFVAKGPDAAQLLGVDSGLYILSRFPILKQEKRAFGRAMCASWDCYSNKGVQFARLQIPGAPFPLDVYNTHMQASRSSDAIRQKQVKILLEFIKDTHQPGAPILFLGDFNFRPGAGDQSFDDFLKGSALVHAGKLCLSLHCATEAWAKARLYDATVDHQFISVDPASSYRIKPLKAERNFGELVKGRSLSDHTGYEIRYEMDWNAAPAATVPAIVAKDAHENERAPASRK